MIDPTSSTATGARIVLIDAGHAGQRLDNFLLTRLKGVPRSHVYRLLRRGEVRVNKGRAGPERRLEEGDAVRIPPVRQGSRGGDERVAVAPDRYAWLEERVLYEDEALLALDKPAGLAVHGGSGLETGLIEVLRRLRPNAPFLELAHRLDRDTSGCLLIAKSRPVLNALHSAWRAGGIDKRYLALVQGSLRKARQWVDAPLQRESEAEGTGGGRRVRVAAEGRESRSLIRPEGHFAVSLPGVSSDGVVSGVTLVEIELLTGRMHQARVHCASIGHPIAGDDKYGERAFNRALRPLGLRRLFLHAARLGLHHPLSGRETTLVAPLPEDLAGVLKSLRAG